MAKSKWEQVKDKLILVEGWARDGLTDEQIAKNLGIGKTTFYRMCKEHLELLEHLKKGKEIIDYEVENALLKRALGYEYIETTKEIAFNPKTGKNELQITKKVTKQVVPDTTAQIFWLKNRRTDKWKDRPEEEKTDDDKVQIINDLPKDGEYEKC